MRCNTLQNSSTVLDNLKKHATNSNYQYKDLYRQFYNEQFYIRAYISIYKNDGSATQMVDSTTADGYDDDRIQSLISKIRNESYQPKPARRTYISKTNGKLRPLGVPSFDDHIIQQICKEILDNIYEPVFSNNSHGFRAKKNCHTALRSIMTNFVGSKYFIEGDIKDFFDNIDHHVLISILKRRIKDAKFIRLIWKFLRSGYVENWIYNKTYSGTPQGGIISPVLANIYLNELDNFVEKTLAFQFNKGTKKQQLKNPAYTNQHKTSHFLYSTNAFRKITYIRHADDFIIGVIGNKDDCEMLKQQIKSFLDTNLKLELSAENTLITYSNDYARFLGYDIRVRNEDSLSKCADGVTSKVHMGKIQLLVPKERIHRVINEKKLVKDINAPQWKMMHRNILLNLSDLEIISLVNEEIRGLYNYFILAENISQSFNKLYYAFEYSCLKTYARKHNTTVSKFRSSHSIGKDWGIRYNNKEGLQVRIFYNQGFKRNINPKLTNPDDKPKDLDTTELE